MPSILEWRVVPAGTHNATIDQVELTFSTITWLKMGYHIRSQGEDYWVTEMLALEAPADSLDYRRTAEGKGRIRQVPKFWVYPSTTSASLPISKLNYAALKYKSSSRIGSNMACQSRWFELS
jgi:hypothetical protein